MNMTVLDQTMKKERPDGWWYPWIFVGAMLFVVFINGIMVFIALDSWTGLETEGHYQKGLAYNQNLEAASAQEALGWQVKLDVTVAGSSGSARVVDVDTEFTGPDGMPLEGLDVSALLLRPTHEGHDREIKLNDQGNGRYSARVELPLAGQWSARIHAFHGDKVFQMERRVRLR